VGGGSASHADASPLTNRATTLNCSRSSCIH